MPFFKLRRSLVALILVAPLSAAHPAERVADLPAAASSAGDFDGAVDLAAIQKDRAESDDGTDMAGGMASYYGRNFDGRRTASGERFDMDDLTAAHRTLPFGSRVRVTNAGNGRSVVVRINDRGPFHGNRVIDVSHAAAQQLGLIGPGRGRVELTLLSS